MVFDGLEPGSANFSAKGRIVNILGFVVHTVFVAILNSAIVT